MTMRLVWRNFAICWTLIITVPLVRSSPGDRSLYFRDCMAFCRRIWVNCPAGSKSYGWLTAECFPCRQECIWSTIDFFYSNGLHAPQFHGKWTFYTINFKIAGFFFLVEEPAAAFFSFLNLYGTMRLFTELRINVALSRHRCWHVWMGHCILGIITWSCSILFHCFETSFTEFLDYVFASAMIVYGTFASISFVLPFFQNTWFLFGVSLIICYMRHVDQVIYQTNINYSYNMLYCVALSAMTTIIYMGWAVRALLDGSRDVSSLRYLVGALALCWAAAIFELYDPPPLWWTLDGHALFHLATAPIPWLWRAFIIAEGAYYNATLISFIKRS